MATKYDCLPGYLYGPLTLKADPNISGSGYLTAEGTITVHDATVADTHITLNYGEIGDGISPGGLGTSGIEIDRGFHLAVPNSYAVIEYQEIDATWRLGIAGSLQAVCTREDIPTDLAIPNWDAVTYKLVTTLNFLHDTANKRVQLEDRTLRIISPDGTKNYDITTDNMGNAIHTTFNDIQFNNDLDLLTNQIISTSNILWGSDAVGSSITTGLRNILIGVDAGITIVSANDDIAIGYNSLKLATGGTNTAIGALSGSAIVAGTLNDLFGYNSGSDIVAQTNVSCIGNNSVVGARGSNSFIIGNTTQYMYTDVLAVRNVPRIEARTSNLIWGDITTGDSITIGTNNIIVGNNAGTAITTSTSNILIGLNCGIGISTSTTNHIAIGNYALQTIATNTTPQIAIGNYALQLLQDGGSTNIAIGTYAMQNMTTGDFNIAIGYESMLNEPTGNRNVSIGYESHYATGTSNDNVNIGYRTLFSLTAGDENVAVGSNSLYNLTGGTDDVAIGYGTCQLMTGGDNNVAIGSGALGIATTGNRCIAIGMQSMGSATTGANDNISIGYRAIRNLTTADNNISIGSQSSENMTNPAKPNIVIGHQAFRNATLARNNLIIGHQAMSNQIALATARDNIAFGWRSLYNNTSGEYNVSIGSFNAQSLTSGGHNITIGSSVTGDSLSLTSGSYNLIIGELSGTLITTGSNNLLLGYQSARYAPIGTTELLSIGYNCAIQVRGTQTRAIYIGGSSFGISDSNAHTDVLSTGYGTGSVNNSILSQTTYYGNYTSGQYTTGTKTNVDLFGYRCAYDLTGGSATDSLSNVSAFGNNIVLGTRITNYCILGNTTQSIDINGTRLMNVPRIESRATNLIWGDTTTGDSITSGTNHILIGSNAGTSLTTEVSNILVGYDAGALLTSSYCVLIGDYAGSSLTSTCEKNIMIGYNTGRTMNANSNNNIAMGYNCMNGAIGGNVGNICLGSEVMSNATNADNNVFVGSNVGTSLINGASGNVGIGANMFLALSSGYANIGIGGDCLQALTTGNFNFAIDGALNNMSTGDANIGLGLGAGDALTTGNENVLIGGNSLHDATSATQIISIGLNSFLGPANTVYRSTSVGAETFHVANANAIFHVAVFGGWNFYNTTNATSQTTAVGLFTASDYTSGTKTNVDLFGYKCAFDLTGGNATDILSNVSAFGNNIVLGTRITDYCILGNTTQSIDINGTRLMDVPRIEGRNTNLIWGNTTTGSGVLGTNNVIIGLNAGVVSTASSNIFIGLNTGLTNSTGTRDTILGTSAGTLMTTATDNTMFGYSTGNALTGSYNTFIGSNAGLLTTTPTYIDIFGYNCLSGSTLAGLTNITALGNSIVIGTHSSNSVILGNTNQVTYIDNATASGVGTGALVLNNGGIYCQDAYINGKLTVIGAIDPTYIDLQDQVSVSTPSAGHSIIWTQTGFSGAKTTDSNGDTFNTTGSIDVGYRSEKFNRGTTNNTSATFNIGYVRTPTGSPIGVAQDDFNIQVKVQIVNDGATNNYYREAVFVGNGYTTNISKTESYTNGPTTEPTPDSISWSGDANSRLMTLNITNSGTACNITIRVKTWTSATTGSVRVYTS